MDPSKVTYVNTEESFEECIKQLHKSEFVCIDCEWLNSYFSLKNSTIFSLIQIATNGICYIIDCYVLASEENFGRIFQEFIRVIINNEKILKIGYSIYNDYEMISRTLSTTSCEVAFDPQNTVDFRELFNFLLNDSDLYFELFEWDRIQLAKLNSGLSQVTLLLLGLCLDKTEQLSDWTKRPLRETQTLYAALDAYCLVDCWIELSQLFQTKLATSINDFVRDTFRSSTG